MAGLVRMIEKRRYCVHVLTQLRAVQAALGKVEAHVLREHVEHCVGRAMRPGRTGAVQQKLDELFEVLSRYGV